MGPDLRSIGCGPTSIASAFNNGLNAAVSDVYNLFTTFESKADQEIATIMQSAGFAYNQVKDVFTNLGDSIAD